MQDDATRAVGEERYCGCMVSRPIELRRARYIQSSRNLRATDKGTHLKEFGKEKWLPGEDSNFQHFG
jgi:hypothetical protein